MALKLKYRDVKEIPAGDERHYVEREGAWMLDVEGVVEKAKLDEFRARRGERVAPRRKVEVPTP